MRIATLMLLAGTLALGACERGSEDTDPVDNAVIELPDESGDNVELLNEAEPVMENSAALLPPPAPPPVVSDEQQVLDDAAATGMTARIPQPGETPPGEATEAANEMLPVD